jgi:hypothetical protein
MIRETWSHPGTSQNAVDGHTGFAGVADYLNKMFDAQISRQLVYNWYARRTSTHFPEKREVESNGRPLRLFNVTEVSDWYEAHRAKTVTHL